MKLGLIVFDVDGTLTHSGNLPDNDVSTALKDLENRGIRIALSSGKPVFYLEALIERIGLQMPIIVAENGCIIVDVAERKEVWSGERNFAMHEIRRKILDRFPSSVKEQENRVEMTFFVDDKSLFEEIASQVRHLVNESGDKVHMYECEGGFDILPSGIDKGTALAKLKGMYGFDKKRVAAVGDGENDIPMFKEAGLALMIGSRTSHPTVANFNTIREALVFLAVHGSSCV